MSSPVVLIVGEAGFGKTTALAQWCATSKRSVAWYSLDRYDQDWMLFVAHLIASGQAVDDAFGKDALSSMAALGPGGPSLDEVVRLLARDFGRLGHSTPGGFSLVLDDFQSVDDSEDVRTIVRALIDRADGHFTVVVSSRTNPALPLGRIRTRGGLARIDSEGLAFTEAEFRDLLKASTNRAVSDQDLATLLARTRGWPALLGLVAIHTGEGRSATGSASLREMSAVRGDMYDFLAEEVIGRMKPELASFYCQISLLDELTPEACEAVSGEPRDRVIAWLRSARANSLTTSNDAHSAPRLVPVIQDFLFDRLVATHEPARIAEMHVRVAERFASTNWRLAATHFLAAGDKVRAEEILEAALPMILAQGEYARAELLLAEVSGSGPLRHIVRSRRLLQRGASKEAAGAAEMAVTSARDGEGRQLQLALQNLATVSMGSRQYEAARLAIGELGAIETITDSGRVQSADSFGLLLDASLRGSLPVLAHSLETMLGLQRARGEWHYAAITTTNLAQTLVLLDEPARALALSEEAARLFGRSSQGYEGVSAMLVAAHAAALLGDMGRVYAELDRAMAVTHPEGRVEAVFEATSLVTWFGSHAAARDLLGSVDVGRLHPDWAAHWRVAELWLEEDAQRAKKLADELGDSPTISGEVGAGFRWHLTRARTYMHLGDSAQFGLSIRAALSTAHDQASPIAQRLAALLNAIGEGPPEVARVVATWGPRHQPLLGVFASDLAPMIPRLPDEVARILEASARANPTRWIAPIRSVVDGSRDKAGVRAALLLAEIGNAADVGRLRAFDRRAKRIGRATGDDLARRLAARIWINDLGVMSVTVGTVQIDGRDLRRKVLALLGFLAAQPKGSATPDQVIEALWPDLTPEQATNSMHQTIYVLRRVIEPDYRAGTSVDYIHFDSELITLDSELVSCRSWEVRDLLAKRPSDAGEVDRIIALYGGAFASDFPYEDWAAGYRDHLHAAFLASVEGALSDDRLSQDPYWRLAIGQKALAIDPSADAIEAQVVRLYRDLGATAAAAEQYGHYATVLRDELGVDPPTLRDL